MRQLLRSAKQSLETITGSDDSIPFLSCTLALSLITQALHRSAEAAHNPSLARLPPEIETLAINYFVLLNDHEAPLVQETLAAIAQTCRRFYFAIRPSLSRVYISNGRQLQKLARAIDNNPAFADSITRITIDLNLNEHGLQPTRTGVWHGKHLVPLIRTVRPQIFELRFGETEQTGLYYTDELLKVIGGTMEEVEGLMNLVSQDVKLSIASSRKGTVFMKDLVTGKSPTSVSIGRSEYLVVVKWEDLEEWFVEEPPTPVRFERLSLPHFELVLALLLDLIAPPPANTAFGTLTHLEFTLVLPDNNLVEQQAVIDDLFFHIRDNIRHLSLRIRTQTPSIPSEADRQALSFQVSRLLGGCPRLESVELGGVVFGADLPNCLTINLQNTIVEHFTFLPFPLSPTPANMFEFFYQKVVDKVTLCLPKLPITTTFSMGDVRIEEAVWGSEHLATIVQICEEESGPELVLETREKEYQILMSVSRRLCLSLESIHLAQADGFGRSNTGL